MGETRDRDELGVGGLGAGGAEGAGEDGREANTRAEAIVGGGTVAPNESGRAGEEGATGGVEGVAESRGGAVAAAPEKLERTREVVAGLLERLGVVADVEVRDGVDAIGCSVRIRSGGDLFAAGSRGQVVEAAEYLVDKMVNRETEGRKSVQLELGGFPEDAADPAVEGMARRLGEAAKRMGKTLTVVPMEAKERRRVHVALAGVEGVQTRSEGDGLYRRLLVEPKGR